MATDTLDRPISGRVVRNYAGAFSAWAASMEHDRALDAVFLERIGLTDGELRALPLPDNMGINLRYRRWQAQCGIEPGQTPERRMELALAQTGPVVD